MSVRLFLFSVALFLLVPIFGIDIAVNHINLVGMSMTPNPKYFSDLSEISLFVLSLTARVAGVVFVFIAFMKLLQKLVFKLTEFRAKN